MTDVVMLMKHSADVNRRTHAAHAHGSDSYLIHWCLGDLNRMLDK